MQPRLTAITSGILAALVMSSGCSLVRPKTSDLPEYAAAKNAIESYEDSEGNYIRPEGLKAEKSKNGLTGDKIHIPWFGNKPLDRTQARKEFAVADQIFQEASAETGKVRKDTFNKAAKQYVLAAKYWPNSALEQDAWMMAGESRFFAEEYPEAEDHYVKLLRNYPRTRYLDAVDKRRMEIALYWIKHDRFEHKPFYVLNFTDDRRPWNDTGSHGKRVLEKLRLDNPTGRLADDATMELANRAFERGNYAEAADIYEDLRTTYPDSPHQFDAHFLGLKSVLETYNGPQYDGQALEESEKLIKTITRQFPEQAKEQKEYLNRVYAEIRYKEAERLWVSGTFRKNRGENLAAVHYFDEILTEYSDTPFGDQATLARAAISDLPPQPTQHLKWLADLVPHNDKVSQLARQVEPAYQPQMPGDDLPIQSAPIIPGERESQPIRYAERK